jgi:hypothetical protein
MSEDKTCIRCGGKALYTLQVYEGEPLREAIAEEDCELCLPCRIALHLWLMPSNDIGV